MEKFPPIFQYQNTSAFRVHFPSSYVGGWQPVWLAGWRMTAPCVEVPTVARDIIYGWARGLVGGFFQDLFAPEEFTHKAQPERWGKIFRFLLRCLHCEQMFWDIAPKHVTRCGVGKISLRSNYLSFDLWCFMTCPIYWEMTSTASTISTISEYPHPCPGHGVWPDHLGLLQLVLPCLR